MLLHEIWPAVVVSGASLARLIKEARRAVGDSEDRQEMIRTLRGSGYRFVADVLVEGGDATENKAERIISHARISPEAAVSSIVSCAEYRIG